MRHEKLFIGISGSSGSGKTTFIKNLQEYYESQGQRCAVVAMDYYYKDFSVLTLEERRKVNFDHPDSLRVDLYAQHFRDLRSGKSVELPTYSFEKHTPNKETVSVDPNDYDVFIGDGILALLPELIDLYDVTFFVNTHLDVCFLRREARDIAERGRTKEQVCSQWYATVAPMYYQFVEPCIRKADMVVENSLHFVSDKIVHFNMQPVINFLVSKKFEDRKKIEAENKTRPIWERQSYAQSRVVLMPARTRNKNAEKTAGYTAFQSKL